MEQPVPERVIVAQIKAIDRTLSVQWVAPPGLWAVFHDLQVEDIERLADATGRDLQQEASSRGYTLGLEECQYAAWRSLQDAKLVCYVSEEDGTFRPLDGRIVEKLQRMDWYRRNLGLRDWKEMLSAKTDILRARRLREEGDVWDCLRRDKLFAAHASDILWGNRPIRSVQVRQGDADAVGERDEAAGAGAGTESATDDSGAARDGVPAEAGGAAAG